MNENIGLIMAIVGLLCVIAILAYQNYKMMKWGIHARRLNKQLREQIIWQQAVEKANTKKKKK